MARDPFPYNLILPDIVEQMVKTPPEIASLSVTIPFGNGLQPPPNRESIDKIPAYAIARSCNFDKAVKSLISDGFVKSAEIKACGPRKRA
jgi:hypothetical protein